SAPVPVPVPEPSPTPVLGEFGRFNSVAEAMAYASGAGGQGPLTVQLDGVITNQNGQIMVYDSTGNLAPGAMYELAPVPVPDPVPTPGLEEFGRFSSVTEAIAYATANGQGPLSVQVDGSIVNQTGQIMTYDSDGNLAPSSKNYEGIIDPSLVFDPAPDPVDVVYESRFSTVDDAIAYAEANGQGALIIQSDGVITNQNLEYMVYDSDGNLAPGGYYKTSPNFIPAPVEPILEPTPGLEEFGRFSSVTEAIAYATANGQGPLSVQVDGSIVNQTGQIMTYDSDGNLAPSSKNYEGIIDPSLVIDPAPDPVDVVYESRFSTVDDAIAYAEANGQGALIIQSDGVITNQNLEYMVYDSDGNLAPGGYYKTSPNFIPAPVVPINDTTLSTVRIPEIGTAAYQALLLETGRKDLIGFNYAAHLNAKDTVDESALDLYLAAESGAEVVEQLGLQDLGALFANASPEQILELTGKFAGDEAFDAFLAEQTTPVAPEIGTEEYDDLLNATGRTDLDEFDYQGYVASVTEAEQALIRTGLDKIYTKVTFKDGNSEDVVDTPDVVPVALIGSRGNENLIGGQGDDVLISSGGEDLLEGGEGKDSVIITTDASNSTITRDIETNNWVVATDAGTDTLVDVERLVFEDTSVALDVSKDQIGGQAVLALGALVGPGSIEDPAFVGLVIGLLDDGMSFDELAVAAIDALSLQSNDALVTTLWTNIVGVAPSDSEKASVIALLDSGTTPAELVRLAAFNEVNESNVDLVGLAQRGLEFSQDGG
ncbi:hypothetical protein N9R40_00705, partial [bacterium]|nr:hypothetical protein [bacterium]